MPKSSSIEAAREAPESALLEEAQTMKWLEGTQWLQENQPEGLLTLAFRVLPSRPRRMTPMGPTHSFLATHAADLGLCVFGALDDWLLDQGDLVRAGSTQ